MEAATKAAEMPSASTPPAPSVPPVEPATAPPAAHGSDVAAEEAMPPSADTPQAVAATSAPRRKILLPHLLAMHEERASRLLETKERVRVTVQSFETSLKSLVHDYLSSVTHALSTGMSAHFPPSPNAVLVLPAGSPASSFVNIQEIVEVLTWLLSQLIVQKERERLAAALPLFDTPLNCSTSALSAVQMKEDKGCACDLCQRLTKLQSRWKALLLRRRVAPMLKQMAVRRRVLQELYDTERTYVSNLETVVRVFLDPLKQLSTGSKPVLNQRMIALVFSTWELILGMNRRVLLEMEERGLHLFAPLPKNASEAQRAERRQKILKSPVQPCVGDVFLRLAPVLKLYTQYINDQHLSQEVLRLRADILKPFFDEQRSKNKLHLDLADFLIMPVQRIPRYELFLKELIKATPKSHPDFAPLEQALAAVGKVGRDINTKKGEAEGRAAVPRVAAQVAGFTRDLVTPARVLMKEGGLEFTRRKGDEFPEPVCLFLFNDLLLVCRNAAALALQYSAVLSGPEPAARPYIYLFHLPLATTAVLMDETAKFPHALFLLDETTGLRFYFFAPSEDDRDAWQRTITEAILKLGSLAASVKAPPLKDGLTTLLAEFETLETAPDPTDPLPLDFVPSEGLVLSTVVAVEKVTHKLFLTAQQIDGEVHLSSERQTWEARFLPNNVCTFRSIHGQYLCAERLPSDLYMPGTVTASRNKAGTWEKWKWARNKRGVFALMSAHKRYLGYSSNVLEAREEAPFFAFVLLSAPEVSLSLSTSGLTSSVLPFVPPSVLQSGPSAQASTSLPVSPRLDAPPAAAPAHAVELPTLSLAALLPLLEEAAALERLIFTQGDAQLAAVKLQGPGPHGELNKRLKKLGKDLSQFTTLRAQAVTMLQGDETLLRFASALREGRAVMLNLKKWAETGASSGHTQVIEVLTWFLSLALAWESVQRAKV